MTDEEVIEVYLDEVDPDWIKRGEWDVTLSRDAAGFTKHQLRVGEAAPLEAKQEALEWWTAANPELAVSMPKELRLELAELGLVVGGGE